MNQPARPAARNTAGAVRAVLDRITTSAHVEAVEPVTPRLRRIRLAGPAVAGRRWTPGLHLRIVVQVPRLRDLPRDARDVLRSYSIWRYDPSGAVELGVLDHPGAGPGALWARELRPGSVVSFLGPEGRFTVRPDAHHHVFVGDETAAVAFAGMIGTLAPADRVAGVVQVAGSGDRFAFPRSEDLTWVTRDTAGPDAEGLVAAVRALSLPAEPGVAYVAGEARSCQAVVGHLVRGRGWPRRAIVVKPFWAPGRRGLD
jgi:NADPH-dependent ferric siderophore reductase